MVAYEVVQQRSVSAFKVDPERGWRDMVTMRLLPRYLIMAHVRDLPARVALNDVAEPQ